VTRENTRDQGVDPVKEFQELQALAGAQTATPPRLDAKTLEEIYQRYRKLLEVAPQTMRPDILNSLEALLREIDPDARQKRKNTASREPVALREERLRQKDAASSSAGSGNSGKTRRKDSVY
jgi:hypothetical protein